MGLARGQAGVCLRSLFGREGFVGSKMTRVACCVAKCFASTVIASYVFNKSLQMLKRISVTGIEGDD